MTSLLLQAVLPLFLLLGAGGLFQRRGLLSEEGEKTLLKLTFNLFLPALILDKLIGSEAARTLSTVVQAGLLGAFASLGGIALAYGWARLLRLNTGSGRRTFAILAGTHNYGFLAIPVIAGLYPSAETLAVNFTFALACEATLWSAGVILLSGRLTSPWKHLVNGPILAICAGLLLNALRFDLIEPAFLKGFFGMLGQCAIPVGLLLVGANIASFLQEHSLAGLLRPWKVTASGLLLRLALIPLTLVGLTCLLRPTQALLEVMSVQAAMPSAVIPVMLAKHYGGHTKTAVQVVVATTGASLVTIPLTVPLLRGWLGLT
ncbi:MAG: AEC family transporter [Verrucomicrobiota bacterium]